MRFSASPAAIVAVAAVFWGLWWLPLRSLDGLGLGPAAINLWLYAVAAILLLPVLWARRARLIVSGVPLCLAAVLFGLAIVAWNGALQTGQVVRVTLLFYLAPIWGTILGRIVLGEPVTGRRVLAIALGLGGALVLLAEAWPPVPPALGDWLGLGAGMVFAGSATAARYGRVDGRALTASAFLAAAIVAGCVAAFGTEPLAVPTAGTLGWIAIVSLLWLVPVTWALLWGAGRLDPGRLALLMLLEVVAAAASAALLTDEPFGLREAAGCALILAAGALEATGQHTAYPVTRRTAL
ncbi:hypothetical protein BAL199_03239 [alpha proteobacterium BAL199]|nr:hypothetical protein BAL199_03239 [alpha proteobacterium BAL199]